MITISRNTRELIIPNNYPNKIMNTATQISVLAGEAFQVPCEHLSFDVPSGANIKVYVSANGEQYSEVTLDGIASAGIVAIECQRNQFFKVTGYTDYLTINLA